MRNTSVFATTRPAGLPRSLLRRLILGNRLPVGARVLLAGDATDELADFLRYLHLEVVRWNGDSLPIPCDLVVCRLAFPERAGSCGPAQTPYHGSLTSPRALQQTAALLAQVRPRGCLALLGPGGGLNDCRGHETGCFHRHLGAFEGGVALAEYSRRTAVEEMSRLLNLRQTRQPRHVLAELRLPGRLLTSFDWQAQASAAARQFAGRPCCSAIGAATQRAA